MTTPRGAPELAEGQALPATTVNEQIRRTEAGACFFPVTDRLTTPPGTCSDGANYIITATATGAWASKENQIATAVGANASNGWYYHTPVEGFTAYVMDENARYLFDGSAWAVDSSGVYTDEMARDAIGTALTAGTGIAITPNDGADTITIATTGRASTTQTEEAIAGFIASPSDKSYTIALKMPHGGTITETTTKSASGTCTATWKINTTALGGTANSVSSTEQSQSHSSSNAFAAGDDVVLTVSSNSSCADMSFMLKYTRTLL